jgi:2'-5' RNA ligase
VFASAELERLRGELADEWAEWLTPQDQTRFSPHVTIQNKAQPEDARRLSRELDATVKGLSAQGEGLALWRYLGGPWEPLRRFKFNGR